MADYVEMAITAAIECRGCGAVITENGDSDREARNAVLASAGADGWNLHNAKPYCMGCWDIVR